MYFNTNHHVDNIDFVHDNDFDVCDFHGGQNVRPGLHIRVCCILHHDNVLEL
jgi:hypothetical protein